MLGLVGLVHRFAAQFDHAPWRWVIPVAAFMLLSIAFLVAALVYPIPGGVSGCEGPHAPAYDPTLPGLAGEQWLRGWAHAKDVRHELWNAAFLLALPGLAVSALGGFVRHHRLVKYQFGLALLCLIVVLFSAHAVDPVYYGGGC